MRNILITTTFLLVSLVSKSQGIEQLVTSSQNATISPCLDKALCQKVGQALAPNTLFISYQIEKIDNQTFLNITTVSQSKLGKSKILAPNIKSNAEKLNQLCQQKLLHQKRYRTQFIEESNNLYLLLIAPIQEALKGKSKLIIVLYEDLKSIPMEVLVSSKADESYEQLDYLLRHFEIVYQYSAASYLQFKQSKPILNNQLLGFAPVFNPKKDNNQSQLSTAVNNEIIRNYDFKPLPYSEKEITEIAKIINQKGQAQVLLGQEATKANLFQQLNNKAFQFVHIASHGVVNDQQSHQSGIVCHYQAEQSSIAFSQEIQHQKIKADLVILSACKSGISPSNQAKSTLAINQSFTIAGANQVLFSLWEIADQPTSQLMIDFYKNYQTTKNYAQALRQAKLKMLRNPMTSTPRYWAAFVLMGE